MAFPSYKNLNLVRFQGYPTYWENELTFEASVGTREGRPQYIFFEGPPSANGLPGIHHVMGRAIKDIFCRYKTQKVFKSIEKAGGIPTGHPLNSEC